MTVKIKHVFFSLLSLLLISSSLFLLPRSAAGVPIGICYGRLASNLPPPSSVVNILKSNAISNIRLFNTNPETLKSFSGTGINLTVGVPNEILPILATASAGSTLLWLQSNIFAYISAAQIRYIAVGNEVFLKDPFYTPYIVPSILNIYQALQILNLAKAIKISSPQASSVLLNSYPSSSATFDPNLQSAIVPLLQFLQDSGSPFMVNVYPFFTYTNNPNHVSLDYALFRGENTVRDGIFTYNNLFDASIDAFVYAMEKEGFSAVPVMVSETGWPKAGGEGASLTNALAFNGNVISRALNGVGTPRRPEVGVEVYLFDLFDEDEKDGEEFEKHFGIFGIDGAKAYDISFN